MLKEITGPLFLKIPVLSLSERDLQIALHLLINPFEPVFVGQVTATDPKAVPILVRFSFQIFLGFDARCEMRPSHLLQQTRERDCRFHQ